MAADLEFRIGAELSEIKAALAGLKKDFTTLGSQAGAAGKPLNGISTGATSAIGALGRLAAGLFTVAAALSAIRKADELTTLSGRLRLATSSTDDFTIAQRELFEVAQRTRSSLTGTVDLFARLGQSTKDAGVGINVLLQVTETVNKAVQLSGATTQAADAALIQLGQGLASGALRGEELNSILEQTPALADAIAKGLGKTRGELRALGQAGKLTAKEVIDALVAQRDAVDQQFATLPVTVGQAFTQVGNAALRLFDLFNQGTGATSGIAGELQKLAEFLSSDEALGAVVEFAAVWSNAFSDIVADVRRARAIIEEATGDIAGTGENLVQILGRAFKELPVNLRTTVQLVVVNLAALVDRVVALAQLAKESIAAVFSDDTVDAAVARFGKRMQVIAQAVRDSTDAILADRDAALKDAKDKGEGAVLARRAATVQDPRRDSRGNFKRPQTEEETRKAQQLRKAELDAIEKLEKDSTDRIANSLKESFDDNLLSADAYYRARNRIELNAAEQAIAVERRRLAGTTDPAERVKITAELELLERQKTDIATRGERERARAVRDLQRELDQVRATDLENQGRQGEAARIRLEAQFRDLLARLQATGDVEGAKLIRKVIDTGVARAQFDDLKAQFDRTLTELQARQAAIADQQRSGTLGPAAANQATSEANQQALVELDALTQKMRELAAATNDPQIIEGARRAAEAVRGVARDSLTGVDAAIAELRASMASLDRDFAKAATGAGVDALTGFFKSIGDGSKSASEKLKDFVRSFAQSMVDIAARALATFLVLQALDAIFPGLGQLSVAGAGTAARVKHSGGDAGQGALRMVSPLAFVGAPRFHEGTGVLGLKPGEIPAILQQGERVQSRSEVAREQSAAAGGQGGGGVRIVNAFDLALVSDHMSSSEGERVILNVIERNAGAVRAKIGG